MYVYEIIYTHGDTARMAINLCRGCAHVWDAYKPGDLDRLVSNLAPADTLCYLHQRYGTDNAIDTLNRLTENAARLADMSGVTVTFG